jgi:zinc protease
MRTNVGTRNRLTPLRQPRYVRRIFRCPADMGQGNVASMRLCSFLAALIVFVRLSPAHADEISLPITTSTLQNGMTVILHEDHSLPIVVLNTTYKVGSRVEQTRRTGFAHLFEHLMFMGTRRVPTKMFDSWMEASGGWNNADTSEDRTEYYDVGPPTLLPLLVWLEADRLRDLGPLMNQEKLDAQRAVVRNERRQTAENQPYGGVRLRLPELLYPDAHPYHHPVIGSHEDLEAASVDDVKAFFSAWYDPANASVVVAGDFEPKETLALITRELGSIPSRGVPKDPGANSFEQTTLDHPTTLTRTVRETIEDQVELPLVVMAWQSPKHFSEGDAELDLLSSVLAAGKASRLYRSLVYDRKLAQTVDATQESGTLGSRFVIQVIARPGVSLDKLEGAMDSELTKLRTAKVSDEELARAKNGTETAFIARLQGVRARASLLNSYQVEVGDPNYAQRDLDRYSRVTSAALQTVAGKVLDLNARVVLRVVPKGTMQGAAQPATGER